MAALSWAVLLGTGCTLVSGVNDLEVGDAAQDGGESDGAPDDGGADDGNDAGEDADVGDADAAGDADAGDADAGPGAVDAVIALAAMSPHPTQLVDCAVVDAADRLLARGLFRLPPAPSSGDYPEVQMTLEGVLVGDAPFELLFYADRNGNQVADAPPTDHSWVRRFDELGEMRFAHVFPLDDLTGETVQPIGDNLVFSFAAGGDDPRDPFSLQDAVYELRVSPPDGRTVALVQLHPDVATPLPDQIVVAGVVDAGNTFTVRVFADGQAVSGGELEVVAPASGPLQVELTRALLGL